MNARSQRLCLWCGPLFAVLFFVGFGAVARFIPPPSPGSSASAVADMYRHHADAIRWGMVISMFGLAFWVPWVAAITVQLKRIERKHAPLTYAWLALGATLPVAFFPALYFFETAAFRTGRSPELIQSLNDMGWLPFTGIIYAIFVGNLVMGVAILSDKRPAPIFPRWFAWFSFASGVLYCPAALDVLSTSGSLAWNGLWSWWLSLVSFFAWLIVTTALTFRAISAQEAERETDDSRLRSALEQRVDELTAELDAVRHDLSHLSTLST